MDHHYNQVFTDSALAMSPIQYRQAACDSPHIYTGVEKWAIIGEWTGAMTDCASYLNGYTNGSRFDASLSGSTSYYCSCAGKNGALNVRSSRFLSVALTLIQLGFHFLIFIYGSKFLE